MQDFKQYPIILANGRRTVPQDPYIISNNNALNDLKVWDHHGTVALCQFFLLI